MIYNSERTHKKHKNKAFYRYNNSGFISFKKLLCDEHAALFRGHLLFYVGIKWKERIHQVTLKVNSLHRQRL